MYESTVTDAGSGRGGCHSMDAEAQAALSWCTSVGGGKANSKGGDGEGDGGSGGGGGVGRGGGGGSHSIVRPSCMPLFAQCHSSPSQRPARVQAVRGLSKCLRILTPHLPVTFPTPARNLPHPCP